MIDLEGPRSCSRHPCSSTHRTGPFEHTKYRIFIITLPRSSKSWFLLYFSGNWNKKGRGLLQMYFNAQLFWIFSPLVGSQEGLSISPLCIEKSISKITLMPRSCTTAGCTKIPREFRSQTNVSDGTFQVNYELWVIDTKQPKIIRFSLFLFMLETDTELEHEKIIFNQNYNIFM